jgi:dTMP kinase
VDSGDGADRYEKETLEVHRRRREAFLDIASIAEPERCVVIDAGQSPQDVAAAIAEAVHPLVLRSEMAEEGAA